MIARLTPSAIDPPVIRPSARVATVAAALDCHPCDVRRLVAAGDLEAHGKGVRGIRVYWDSVADYQTRKALPARGGAAQVIHRPKARAPASTAAYRAAMAGLQAKGLA
jgi:hypothetical protein